jgi:hypothetical protein
MIHHRRAVSLHLLPTPQSMRSNRASRLQATGQFARDALSASCLFRLLLQACCVKPSPILSLVLGRQKQRAKNIRFDSDRSNTITCDKFLNLLDYLHSKGSVQGSWARKTQVRFSKCWMVMATVVSLDR